MVQVDRAVREPALVHQVELESDAAGERPGATADQDRRDEQVELVDQTGRERRSREPGAAADTQIAS